MSSAVCQPAEIEWLKSLAPSAYGNSRSSYQPAKAKRKKVVVVIKLITRYRGLLARTSCTPSPCREIALATPFAIVSSLLFTNSTISACRRHANAVFAHHTPILYEYSLSMSALESSPWRCAATRLSINVKESRRKSRRKGELARARMYMSTLFDVQLAGQHRVAPSRRLNLLCTPCLQ